MPTIDTLIAAERIAARVEELAAQIRHDFQGKPITVVCVLRGSFVFTADLVRALPESDVEVLFLGVSSYAGRSSTGAVRITHDLHTDIEGRNCLVVEDIVDTGLTLRYLRDTLELRHPAMLKIATLLDKPSRRTIEIEADYVGFEIPDEFVIGYGLDLDQRYRNLPYVGVFRADDTDDLP